MFTCLVTQLAEYWRSGLLPSPVDAYDFIRGEGTVIFSEIILQLRGIWKDGEHEWKWEVIEEKRLKNVGSIKMEERLKDFILQRYPELEFEFE